MKGILEDWKFSAKAGCQRLELQSRLLFVFVMDMVILAHSSLKVCFFVFSKCFFENDVWMLVSVEASDLLCGFCFLFRCG